MERYMYYKGSSRKSGNIGGGVEVMYNSLSVGLYWYKNDMLLQIIYAKGKESQLEGLFFAKFLFHSIDYVSVTGYPSV